ncbi:adaptin N terminal region-domain-containing protein [Pyronema domesticum]|uniref:Coatomer subunit beta n=1 Tax=Pyronema omphalodes (strain CBS 100304) TaxID=1076935 RepID=U4KY43_PYROM|nr:adaptin N terminal region-domain-containing protein [Pyronema domesticum]CCX06881.1 Similar to Coatomer subunit beta; acc. no. Q9UUF7 [Pyronema omphalodes CBS 100304]
MPTFLDTTYSMVHMDHGVDRPTPQQLRTQLEKGTEESKQETMRMILTMMLNGDPLPQLLMPVINAVSKSSNSALKKLLYLYYEICPKYDASGKLKQEMILICDAILNDLKSHNEYISAITLRFLCKIKEPEILEPLMTTVRKCLLEHRHTYARKNAVFAVSSIYQHSPQLIPDAPDLILTFLQSEHDNTCRRNAFAALSAISPENARVYLESTLENVPQLDELMQLVVIEFIRKDAVENPDDKPKYLALIFDLLEASSNTVIYEAATALSSLSSSPVAIKAAASKFIELAIKESDNNVKLIVLEKVDVLRKKNDGMLGGLAMDILRVLSSPDLDVRKKALDIAMDMVSSKNIEEVTMLLKKEIVKTVDHDYEKNNEYRQLLIHAIHSCTIKSPEAASSAVSLLIDYLSEFNSASSVDVIAFVKEVVERFPALRPSIVERLMNTLTEVRSAKVYRSVLWIIGEYCTELKDIRGAWKGIRASLGEIPILASEQRLLDEQPDGETADQNNGGNTSAPSGSRKVLADGTYATESALTSEASAAAKLEAVKAASKPPLRSLILDGEYYLSTILASTLAKLVMRHAELSPDIARTNALKAEAMLIMISIVRVGQSPFVKAPIDEDSIDRIMCCVRSLAEFEEKKEVVEKVFLEDTRSAFRAMVQAEEKKRNEAEAGKISKNMTQVDDVLNIRQLGKKTAGLEEDTGSDLMKATGADSVTEDLSSKLSRVVQLTGFSDPVYAEATVQVHQFDIILDVLLVNQTVETLQNLTVEFATLGDLKVIEKPSTQNLGPRSFQKVQCTIKVSSTDTGVIFGNVVYDGASSTDTKVVILNDVHVDIMDYIKPAYCTESQFRTMWTEFEWENKVNINSKAKTLRDFLAQLMKNTNMACLTPEASLKGDCQFLSANLYARSVFGEDALANLSIEKDGENGPITGFVRIRSRSQGLALSLGALKGLNKAE